MILFCSVFDCGRSGSFQIQREQAFEDFLARHVGAIVGPTISRRHGVVELAMRHVQPGGALVLELGVSARCCSAFRSASCSQGLGSMRSGKGQVVMPKGVTSGTRWVLFGRIEQGFAQAVQMVGNFGYGHCVSSWRIGKVGRDQGFAFDFFGLLVCRVGGRKWLCAPCSSLSL